MPTNHSYTTRQEKDTIRESCRTKFSTQYFTLLEFLKGSNYYYYQHHYHLPESTSSQSPNNTPLIKLFPPLPIHLYQIPKHSSFLYTMPTPQISTPLSQTTKPPTIPRKIRGVFYTNQAFHDIDTKKESSTRGVIAKPKTQSISNPSPQSLQCIFPSTR
jgi:hypothetical protein